MQELFETKIFFKTLFNAIPAMVLIVDSDGRVNAINRSTQNILAIEEQEAYLKTRGEIFRCIYSKADPRGCGYSEVCQKCEVRITAMNTINGQCITRAKAKLNVYGKENKIITMNLLISSAPMEYKEQKYAAVIIEDVSNITELQGLLPICCSCKKIRDDEGYWNQVEKYLEKHSEVEFTHGMCPDCMKKLYPQYAHKFKAE